MRSRNKDPNLEPSDLRSIITYPAEVTGELSGQVLGGSGEGAQVQAARRSVELRDQVGKSQIGSE